MALKLVHFSVLSSFDFEACPAGRRQDAPGHCTRPGSNPRRLHCPVRHRGDGGRFHGQGPQRAPAGGPTDGPRQAEAPDREELGYLPLEPDAAHVLFQLVSRRYEKRARCSAMPSSSPSAATATACARNSAVDFCRRALRHKQPAPSRHDHQGVKFFVSPRRHPPRRRHTVHVSSGSRICSARVQRSCVTGEDNSAASRGLDRQVETRLIDGGASGCVSQFLRPP